MGPRLWALLASIIWVVSPAEAGPRLLGAGDAPSLPAWVEFCQASPLECTIDPSEPEFVTLTPDTYALLQSVNLSVNSTLRPITDQNHWGLADLWSYPGDGAGDCEDFQLLKRKLLVEAGLPRRAMLMTVVLDEKDEGHAILTVRTDRGDFILDNKTDKVVEWYDTHYTYIKRESARKAEWVYLTLEPDQPIVTAAQN